MARYLKHSVNNNWDKVQDADETPVREIEIAPETTEVLVRRFTRALEQYRLWRDPETARYLKRLAAILDERAIAGMPERVA